VFLVLVVKVPDVVSVVIGRVRDFNLGIVGQRQPKVIPAQHGLCGDRLFAEGTIRLKGHRVLPVGLIAKRLGNRKPRRDLQAPYRVEPSFPSRRELQLPAAALTLESFLRFHLGCCASAAWTLHRANVSHNVNFSWLLTSFRIRDIGLNSCPIGEALRLRARAISHAFLVPRH